jgi:hypothetical protein
MSEQNFSMIIETPDTLGTANVYAVMLVIHCSRESMATMRQIGLACRTTVALANAKLKRGEEPGEVYDVLTGLVASNLTTEVRETAQAADRWAQGRCERAVAKGLLDFVYLTEGREDSRRRKYYLMTKQGKLEFTSLDAEFDLVYVKPKDEITGFGVVRRN